MDEVAEMTLPSRPEDKITIVFAGEPREIFMSFLRLNSLLRVVDEAPRVVMITVDPDLGEMVLRALLVEKPGADMFDFVLEEGVISNEAVERLQMWAQDHLTYFFMKRFQQIGQTAAKLEPLAKALQSSAPGSAPST